MRECDQQERGQRRRSHNLFGAGHSQNKLTETKSCLSKHVGVMSGRSRKTLDEDSRAKFSESWMNEEKRREIRANLNKRLNKRTRPLVPPRRTQWVPRASVSRNNATSSCSVNNNNNVSSVSSNNSANDAVDSRAKKGISNKNNNCNNEGNSKDESNKLNVIGKKKYNLRKSTSITAEVVKRSGISKKRASSSDEFTAKKTCFDDNVEEEEDMEWEDCDPGLQAEISHIRSGNVDHNDRNCFEKNEAIEAKNLRFGSSKSDGLVALVVVLDTNVLVSHLSSLKMLLTEPTFQSHVHFLLPWIVLCELDGLKNRESNNVGKRAREAINFIHDSLQIGHPQIKGQSLDDEQEALSKAENDISADDRIVYSCRFIKHKTNCVLLFTNDKHLINKAAVNNIKAFTASKIFAGIGEHLRKLRIQGIVKTLTKDEEIASAMKAFKELWQFLFVYTRSLGDALRIPLPSSLPPLRIEDEVKFASLPELKLCLLILRDFVNDLSDNYESYMGSSQSGLTTESSSVVRLHCTFNCLSCNNEASNCLKQLPPNLPSLSSLPLVTRRALHMLACNKEQRSMMDVGRQQLSDMRQTLQYCQEASSRL